MGRLRKPSPQIRFHLASAQASASPRQGPACVAWVWVSDPHEDDFCTSWLPHLPPLGRGPLLTSAQRWPLSFQLEPSPRPFCTGRPPCNTNAVTYPNEFSRWSSSKASTGQRALGFITCGVYSTKSLPGGPHQEADAAAPFHSKLGSVKLSQSVGWPFHGL